MTYTPSVETVERWDYKGHQCKINWVQLGPEHAHWTGYATTSLRETYPIEQEGIRVNGGITYGIDEDGFVGFDCHHAWDACLRDEQLYGVFVDRENVTEWTKGMVKDEVESLVDQLEEIERRLPSTDLREVNNRSNR